DAAGNIVGAIESIRDFTERKRTEEALRASEEKYRAIIENMQEGYHEVDIKGNFTFVNESMCKMLGYEREELLGMNNRQYADEENSRKVYKVYNRVYRTGESVENFEWQLVKKDGEHRDIEVSISLIKNAEGHPIGFRGIVRDTTDRKRAEDALRESEEKYRNILRSIEDGYHEVDLKGNFTFVSSSMVKILGYEESELIGMNYRKYMGELDAKSVFKAYNEVYRTGIPSKLAGWEFIRKDGTKIAAEGSVSLVKSKDQVIGFRGIIRDITERKQAEEEKRSLEKRLQRAEKMEALGTLAGGVAHDLNNVLGVLVGYSELLLQNVPQDSPFQRHAMQIFKGGQRAAAIIQDLLTLTRRGVVVSETLNLNRIILDFMQMPEFEAIKSYHPGVQFKTSLEAGLLNIKGSSTHLNKTVMNLLSNAAEAIAGSGEVLIRTENRYVDRPIHGHDTTQEGEYAVLTVSDTGSGISPADLGRIFEPFYTKKVMGRSGTGLGLAVVWGTVKDHDGYIDVQSTEDKGSIFTLYFPVTREDLTKAEQVVPQGIYMGRGEHILVVDDVEGQRLLASAMLDSLGYKVSSVASGEEAIEFVRNKPVDLLLLDMIMDPGMDGLDTYRSILAIRPKQKAIIVSGYSETDRVKAAQSLGAGTYVRKPYVMEKLGLAVKKELDRK
ncbi:MAG: PAS domain S-box protein, partial [Syntrophales bacterium]